MRLRSVLVGLVFLAGGCAPIGEVDRLVLGSPSPSTSPSPTPSPSTRPDLRALVAWSPDVVPARSARVLERMSAVHDATTAEAGMRWLGPVRRPGGAIVRPPSGYSYPFEVAYIHPRGFARFAPPRFRSEIRTLERGELLIPQTEARLRGVGEGARFNVSGRVLRVAGVIGDHAAQGYEALLRGPRPGAWSAPDRFVLIHLSPNGKKRAVRKKLLQISEPGLRLALRSEGVKPFLRYADAVQPQLRYKASLGEFPARPLSGGAIQIAPAWLAGHIVYRSVPLLGTVRCHRKLIPMLRDAMTEVRNEGLSSTVRDFEGCFNARAVRDDPAGRLSHHSWGAAVDINASSNALGGTPHQDPRLVRIMRRHGFTWGGRWVRPDGMHFEWWKFPS